MDDLFELEVHPTYLHISYPPGHVIASENMQDKWRRIGKICREHGIAKVLIEADKPERHLDTGSAFDAGRALAENMSGLSVAICFHDYEFDELSAFFKTVAQNRGVRMEFFSNLGDALE
ncbi:MAG TPA: hypothetical protein VMS29_10685, partial [Pyrinomonadaceae bacterium]|nr:hypothetical protein [Pyrinomonadaceae bacterium]